MKKLTKILALVLALALTAVVSVSLTLAYLTDTDEAVNVMTLGNVSIEQIEQERDENGNLVEFTQAKPAYPAVGPIDWADEGVVVNGTAYKVFTPDLKNVVDKIVTVNNTGKSDAYIRTIVAIEAPEGDPNNLIRFNYNITDVELEGNFVTKINGVDYYIASFVYAEALEAGAKSAPSLMQVLLDSKATNEDCAKFGQAWEILVKTQAVQTEGFDTAEQALNTAFGEINEANVQNWFGAMEAPKMVDNAEELADVLVAGGNVILTKDIENAPVNTVAPYGNYYGVALNGGELNGNGKVLDFDIGELKGGKADNYGIMTSGGTIKNATIGGVFRGIMIMNPTEDLYIDNVTIGDEDVCYGINTGEGNGQHDLIVTNSTLMGWNSFGTAVNSVSFTDCTFAQGTYYTNVYGRLVKPYVDTVFENCEFSSMYYIDLSQLSKDGDGNVIPENADAKIVLRNCTVNGVKLTAENWSQLIVSEGDCGAGQISIELKDGTYMTAATGLADYVIIE